MTFSCPINAFIPKKQKQVLEEHQIAFEEGNHTLEEIYKAHEVVKSPGIPDHIALIQNIKGPRDPSDLGD